jgi:hypothetical protein
MKTGVQTQVNAPSKPSFTPAQLGLLQRKCACGGSAGLGGQCDECQTKKLLGLQTKLAVGESGDIYEQEADRIADQVMALPAHPSVSGAPSHIQRFSGQSNGQTDAAPASVDRVLASPPSPLEPVLRQGMEQRFGHDFSRIRVHSGTNAAQSGREVSANAYTVGHETVFGTGRSAPGTHEGLRLIAHKLTHVVQQTDAGGIRLDQSDEKHGPFPIHFPKRLTGDHSPLIQTKLKVGKPNDRYEREADDVAATVMRMPLPPVFREPEKEEQAQTVRALPLIQRQVEAEEEEEEEEEEELIQMKPQVDFQPPSMPLREGEADRNEVESLPSPAEEPLTAGELTRGGSVLPVEIRSDFEQRMGYDLGAVRIHQGSQAERFNERLRARAFTVGSHVWLGQGQALGSTQTLAHEFVHVVQQTQPPMLSWGMSARGEPPLRAGRSIQREEVFWGPDKTFDPADEVQDAIVANKTGIQKEVWVPGASRGGVKLVEKYQNLDKDRGIADLYKSGNGKRVGLYFRTGSEKCYPEGEPKNLPRGEAPRVEYKKGRPQLLYLLDAPEEIRLGEVKPLAFIEQSSGAKQVDGYKEGIENTARLLKEFRARAETSNPKVMTTADDCPTVFVESGQDKQWSPTVDLLEISDYGPNVKAETLIPVASGRQRTLALYTFDPEGKPKKGTSILPPRDLQRHVYGDLYYVIHDGLNAGVVTYAWLLTNPIDLTNEINRLTRRQQGHEARARAAHNRLVVPLLRPVISQAPAGTAQGLPLRESRPIQREPAKQTLRRQPKPPAPAKEPPGTDANFNLSAWLADHSKLGKELKSRRVRENNEAVKFLAGAVQAQKQLERLLPRANVPARIKGAEGLKKKYPIPNLLTGSVAPGSRTEKREMTLPEMVALSELWTSKRVVPLAYLRKAFGGFMVGVLNWLGDIPEKFRKWRKGHDESDEKITQDQANKASKHGKLITGILRLSWSALKIALGKAFGQAVRLLLSSTKRGVFNHFKKLFIFDVLKADDPNGPLAYALGIQQQIESLYDQLRSLVGDALKPFIEFTQKFKDFYDFLKNFRQIADIISKLKTTLRLIKYSACAAGGWWGIAKCLVTTPAEDLMLLFISACPVRKEIASILFGLSWVRNLPREIASAMRSTILSFLPPQMNDLIDEIPFLQLEPIELSCDQPPEGATSGGGGQAGKGNLGGGGAGTGGKAGGMAGGAALGEGEGEGVFAIDAKNTAGVEKPANIIPGYAVQALAPDCSHVEAYKAGNQNKEGLYRTMDVVVQDRKTKSPVVVIRNVKVKIVKVIDRGSGIGTVKYSPLNAERLCPAEPADVREGCLAALPKELHNARLVTDPKKGSISGELPYCSALEELKE